MRCSGCANEHRVQGTFVLFPVGTLYHGTPETRLSWQGAIEPFSHKQAQLATGAGHSSPCQKAGAFWPQKGKWMWWPWRRRPCRRCDHLGGMMDKGCCPKATPAIRIAGCQSRGQREVTDGRT
jgi:hypothetical protein